MAELFNWMARSMVSEVKVVLAIIESIVCIDGVFVVSV